LKKQVFANQLWHLTIADVGLSVIGFLPSLLDRPAQPSSYEWLGRFDMGFVCTAMSFQTLIACGFVCILRRMDRMAQLFKVAIYFAWPLAFLIGMTENVSAIHLWAVTNLLFCFIAWLSCCIYMRNQQGMAEAVVWRMAKFYFVFFFFEHSVFATFGAWRILYPYFSLPTPKGLASVRYLLFNFRLDGFLNSICYASNAQLTGQEALLASCLCINTRRKNSSPQDLTEILSLRVAVLAGSTGDNADNGDTDDFATRPSSIAIHGCRSNPESSIDDGVLRGLPSPTMSTGLMVPTAERFRKLHGSQAQLKEISQRIDTRWVQETQINCFAEVLNVLLQTTQAIEGGSDKESTKECIANAYKKVDEQKEIALESLKVRSSARGMLSLASGLSGIEQTIIDQHTDAVRWVRPYFDRLENFEHSPEQSPQ
jgi:hypothetical protein